MHFAAAFPTWTGRDGFPLSWRHFVYGMAYLGRQTLREQLARVESFRLGNAAPDEFRSFQRDVSRMTEVPRDG